MQWPDKASAGSAKSSPPCEALSYHRELCPVVRIDTFQPTKVLVELGERDDPRAEQAANRTHKKEQEPGQRPRLASGKTAGTMTPGEASLPTSRGPSP